MYVESVVRILVVLAKLYLRLIFSHETRFSCVQYLLKNSCSFCSFTETFLLQKPTRTISIVTYLFSQYQQLSAGLQGFHCSSVEC